MAKKPTKLTTTANGAVVTGKEDLTKIKTATKTPEQTTVQEDLVNIVSMVKDVTTELTELSQELGLYDVEGNPLVKDNTTMPVEASTEALEPIADETNATVAQEPENDSSIATEPLNDTPVEDKLTLKDGQGKPIPTKLVVIQSINYTDLVSQALYAGYLGSELDRSFRILSTVPFRIRVLMPEDQYENFLSKESQVVFDENLTYNKVLVKAFDLYTFWKNVIKVGKEGAFVVPREVVRRKPLMAPCYMRMPIADTPESRVDFKKVIYTRDELESFSLASLKACASWYDIPSSNSKLKYIKAILESQGN